MNEFVISNYRKLKLSLLFLPLSIVILIVLFLYSQNALSVEGYVAVQKNVFYFLNSELSRFPVLQFNLTQFGDALIFLSLLTVFIVYAPKIWEALISALLVSAVFSFCLKEFFSVPRPATIFDNDSFSIIGKTLVGYSSLPSGHTITIFTILTVLLFSFLPKKSFAKVIWCFSLILIGFILAFTRVGVGAHHPLDVLIGSTIGFFSGLMGIFISRKYKLWHWVSCKKYYPVFILLFVICIPILINKIIKEPLIIFYFAIISLLVSLYLIINSYVKK